MEITLKYINNWLSSKNPNSQFFGINLFLGFPKDKVFLFAIGFLGFGIELYFLTK